MISDQSCENGEQKYCYVDNPMTIGDINDDDDDT